jgi:phosphate transport system substrate-binding protein
LWYNNGVLRVSWNGKEEMEKLSQMQVKFLSTLKSGALLALVVVLGVSLTSCGEDPSNKSAGEAGISGNFAASGASSQKSAVDAWVASFGSENPDAKISYDPKGSGGGRKDLGAGAVLFAGTDSPLKDQEISDAATGGCQGGSAFEVPVYVSPIAVVFNLSGINSINLDAKTTAKIFSGAITTWNDAAITALNPGVTLPATQITPVHRSDESGTTENFTDYLSKASQGEWRFPKSGSWPIDGGQSGKGSSGMSQIVNAAEGTIGYVDESQAGKLGKVSIGADGVFVAPSAAEASKAVAASPIREGLKDGRVVVDIKRDLTADQGYPLALISYDAACTYYKDVNNSKFVKAWLKYITSEQGQEVAHKETGSAPLPESLRTKISTSIDAIK